MLVYGDHSEHVDPDERLTILAETLACIEAMPGGIDRHAKLVGALIEAGQLQQGVEDAGAESRILSTIVYALAMATVRSWDSGFAIIGGLPQAPRIDLPPHVELRLPEGFAFYAVYPEAYIEAARRLSLSGPARVIGIRSIGTTLGAVVAAALDAGPPVTVRPFGDPFARELELSSAVLTEGAHYVIVDEGPGLSGSSFGAVADWLEARGVPLERIAFLPSHGGDLGPRASDAHRARWAIAQRVTAEFDPRFLAEWFGPLEQFSTGEPWERLKFVGRFGDCKVLLKFAGLGVIGERKLEMARALHAAGLVPEPVGLVHGFLIERWSDDALHLAPEDKPIAEIGRYIGIRALLFPAPEDSGATIEGLLAMCRRNLAIALGERMARKLERWNTGLLSSRIRRVRTDNKLDRDEWLRIPDGGLLKTDAVDHHCGHDLIGCQDIAWDVAGAIVEFALNDDEARQLIQQTEGAAGHQVSRGLLDFYRVAYCCFRIAQGRLSAELCSDDTEKGRLTSGSVRYETAIMPLLRDDYCCFTRHESSVD